MNFLNGKRNPVGNAPNILHDNDNDNGNGNEIDVKAIFFDVDGTLSDAHCNEANVEYYPEQYAELLNLLNMLKNKGVKLFILTRCQPEHNIFKEGNRNNIEYNSNSTGKKKIRTSSEKYYKQIVELMDGVFSADESIKINPDEYHNTKNVYYWAFIKSLYMKQYEKLQTKFELLNGGSLVLIDDNETNAIVAANQGFRSYSKASSGNALDMTNNALMDILNSMGVQHFDPDTKTFNFREPEPEPELVENLEEKVPR